MPERPDKDDKEAKQIIMFPQHRIVREPVKPQTKEEAVTALGNEIVCLVIKLMAVIRGNNKN